MNKLTNIFLLMSILEGAFELRVSFNVMICVPNSRS